MDTAMDHMAWLELPGSRNQGMHLRHGERFRGCQIKGGRDGSVASETTQRLLRVVAPARAAHAIIALRSERVDRVLRRHFVTLSIFRVCRGSTAVTTLAVRETSRSWVIVMCKRTMILSLTLLAILGAAPLLSACHTTAGAGEDISDTGKAIERSADQHAP